MKDYLDLIVKLRNQRPEAKLGEQWYAIPKLDKGIIREQVRYYYNPGMCTFLKQAIIAELRASYDMDLVQATAYEKTHSYQTDPILQEILAKVVAADQAATQPLEHAHYRTAVDFVREICVELDYTQFQNLTAKDYKDMQESAYPVSYLIQKSFIHPFCLMLNNRFIRWDYIDLICATEKFYLLVRGMPEDIFNDYFFGDLTSMSMIILPGDITYKYAQDVDEGVEITDRTIFAFDKTGALVTEGTANVVISADDDDLMIVTGTPNTDGIFVISNDLKYSYFPENVMEFQDNILVPDPSITMMGPILKEYFPTSTTHIRAFFNKKGTPNYDHLHKLSYDAVSNDIIEALNSGSTPEYLRYALKPFAIDTNVLYSKERNTIGALDTIANYDLRLFNELYKEHKKFISMTVDYTWLTEHLDEDGYLRIPRRFNLHINYYVLMFINGELYSEYSAHKYEKGDFVISIDGIGEDDSIEFWYFLGAKNFTLDMNIDPNEPYLDLDDEYYYIEDDTTLWIDHSPNAAFEYPKNGLQNFPVDYSFEVDEEDDRPHMTRFRVRFPDEYWYAYGQNLTMASKNRFAYYHATVDKAYIEDEQSEYVNYYKIDLEDHFMYCNDYDRYMVFYNGRRLGNDHYRLVLPCDDSVPFYRYQIYICKPMKLGDKVDIFYMPHYCVDVHKQDFIENHGRIEVSKDLIWYALDNELYTFWLNGKKIPKKDLANINSNSVQILTDQETIAELRVTAMVEYNDDYELMRHRFRTYTSDWDRIVMRYTNINDLLGITPDTQTNIEPSQFQTTFPPEAILREIYRDWYVCNKYVDITQPFHYNYRYSLPEEYIEEYETYTEVIDGEEVELLIAATDFCDAAVDNNLDVERPVPGGTDWESDSQYLVNAGVKPADTYVSHEVAGAEIIDSYFNNASISGMRITKVSDTEYDLDIDRENPATIDEIIDTLIAIDNLRIISINENTLTSYSFYNPTAVANYKSLINSLIATDGSTTVLNVELTFK